MTDQINQNTDSLSGRDLDAAVHQRVLGKRCRFVASEPNDTRFGEGPLGFTSNFGGAEFTADRDWLVDDWIDDECNLELAHYSESWDAIHPVLEEMQRRAWSFVLEHWPGKRPRAEFFNPRVSAYGDTIPEAVCRAALLALETEKQ